MCTAINGIVTDEQVRMDSAENRAEVLTSGTRDTTPVTSAQAPDLTDGRDEIRAPMDQNQMLLAADPESVKAAREFTTETLRCWQLDALMDESVMIASELVTNAVRHGACQGSPGSGKIGLSWQRHVGRLICVVTDGSRMPPVLMQADMDSESGRGLHVVDALAAGWGWTMVGTSEKAVWAVLALP
jgi:anti-sigma regulatory factor (Ser/Thr protein kinase)